MMLNLKNKKFAEIEYKHLPGLNVSNESLNEVFYFKVLSQNKNHPLNKDACLRNEILQMGISTESFISNIFSNLSSKFKSFVNSFTSKNLEFNVKDFDDQTKQLYKDRAGLITKFNSIHIEELDKISVQIMSGLQVDLKTGTNILINTYSSKNLLFYINIVNEIDTIVCRLMSDDDFRIQIKEIKINNESELKNIDKNLFNVTNSLINPKSILDYAKLTEVIKQKEDMETVLNNLFKLSSIFKYDDIKKLNNITNDLGNNLDGLLEVIKNHDVQIPKEHITKLFNYLDLTSSIISHIGMQFKIYRSFISTVLNINAQLNK